MNAVDALLWAGTAVTALAAVRWSLPRPLELDEELFFKLVLSTLARGEEEAAGGDRAGWMARVRRTVWYRPGARELGARLRDPQAAPLPVPPRPGERAFVDLLARATDPDARLRLAFLEPPFGDELLFDDPELVGEAYGLEPVLGPGVGWDAVASWDDAVRTGLRRRAEHLRWAVVGWPELAAALGAELGAGRVADLPVQPADALVTSLEGLLTAPAERLVPVGVGEGAARVARALHASPRLRDRVRAVVGIAARLGGEEADWLAGHFDHASMDTEISRATPWFHLAFAVPGCDPPGEEGTPLEETAWPSPPTPPSGRVSVEPVDLGVLPGPREAYPVGPLGRALALTVVTRLVRKG